MVYCFLCLVDVATGTINGFARGEMHERRLLGNNGAQSRVVSCNDFWIHIMGTH